MSRLLMLMTMLWVTAAVAGPFEDGVAALERGRHARALELLTEAAEAGKGEAQFLVGKMHLDGSGTEVDAKAAVMWLERAAANDYRKASLLLGKIYASGMGVAMDPAKSAAHLQRAAEQKRAGDDDEDCE